MTTREFFTAVAKGEISDEIKDTATALIEKLDKRNENRNSKPSKTAVANEPIKVAILEMLKDQSAIASDIAEKLEISTQKASALCRQLVENGSLDVAEIKVPKKGKVKSYSLKKQ